MKGEFSLNQPDATIYSFDSAVFVLDLLSTKENEPADQAPQRSEFAQEGVLSESESKFKGESPN